MFLIAARTLAAAVTDADRRRGAIFPPLEGIRDVSVSIATAVARVAYEQDLAGEPRLDNLEALVRSQIYDPRYEAYA